MPFGGVYRLPDTQIMDTSFCSPPARPRSLNLSELLFHPSSPASSRSQNVHSRIKLQAPDLTQLALQTSTASSRSQWALTSTASSISVGTAGPQPPRRSPTASSRCEWHRELQISAAGSQWALPDRELQMSVGLAGPHCRTASATAH